MTSNPPACLALDYGSTISTRAIDHLIGQKPVDPDAAAALRTPHDDHGQRLILASNTQPHETRWQALQKAGIDDLFSVALLSYPLGVRILRTTGPEGRSGLVGWAGLPPEAGRFAVTAAGYREGITVSAVMRTLVCLAWADGGFPALRAVRCAVRAAAGACPVLLGSVPGGVEPGAHARAPGGGRGAGLVGCGDGGRGAAAGRGAGPGPAAGAGGGQRGGVVGHDGGRHRGPLPSRRLRPGPGGPGPGGAPEGGGNARRAAVRPELDGLPRRPRRFRPAPAGPGRRGPAGGGLDVGAGAGPCGRACPEVQGRGR